MRRALLASLLFVALCPSSRGDEIVLRSGRTLSGAIVKEDERLVTLQVGAGEISIARADIQEIRRAPATAGKDEAPPAKKPDAAPRPTSPGQPKDTKSPARVLLDEMNSIALAPWTHEGPVVVTEHTIATYKVVAADGTSSVTYTRPKSATGVAALYLLSHTTDGRTIVKVDGEDQWYWNRLYWNDDSGTWTQINPAETRFQADSALAHRIADLCCKDENARAAASADARSIAAALRKDRAASAEKERAKLREDCALAAGSKDAGEALAQVLERETDIAFARNTQEMVTLAMKRREALRRLVDSLGR